MAQAVLGGIGTEASDDEVARAAARALGVERCRIVREGSARAMRRRGPTSLVPSAEGFTVPLVAGGRALGLLEVGPAAEGEEPRWSTPGFATAVAGLVAVAVERGGLIAAALDAEGLRRSDGLKTALLHGVSHEFRTPLTAIRTAADALSVRGAHEPGEAALLEVMTDETDRLDRLVANLLDLSRLEAGALVARMDWCAPAEIVAGALDAAAPLVGGRGDHDATRPRRCRSCGPTRSSASASSSTCSTTRSATGHLRCGWRRASWETGSRSPSPTRGRASTPRWRGASSSPSSRVAAQAAPASGWRSPAGSRRPRGRPSRRTPGRPGARFVLSFAPAAVPALVEES